ncbi:MAG: hypothetical protein ABIU20_07920 [Blastocatellia bacterium]
MAKKKEETKEPKNAKSKDEKESKEAKEPKEPKGKDGKVLMKRVKKAIKRSRRKLSEEKFEKELQRTIGFLEELQRRLNPPPASEPVLAVESIHPSGRKSRDKSGNGKAQGRNKPTAKVQVTVGAQSDPSITGKEDHGNFD